MFCTQILTTALPRLLLFSQKVNIDRKMLKTLVFERDFPGITAAWPENAKVGRRCKESVHLLPLDKISNIIFSATYFPTWNFSYFCLKWSPRPDLGWGGSVWGVVTHLVWEILAILHGWSEICECFFTGMVKMYLINLYLLARCLQYLIRAGKNISHWESPYECPRRSFLPQGTLASVLTE